MIRAPLFARLRDLLRPHPGWVACAAAVALAVIGILAIGTADAAHSPRAGFAQKQTVWLVISIAVMAFAMSPHPRQVAAAAPWLLGVTLFVLVLIVLPFMPRSIVPRINGIRAWINLGFMNFQPSEVAKLVFVLVMAGYLQHRDNHRTLRGLLKPFLIMLVPVMLILRQPDLGTAILFAPALFAMLVAAGAKLRHMVSLGGLGVVGVALIVASVYLLPDSAQLLRPHQRMRIKSMISLAQNETRYVDDEAYQQYKTLGLIGSGRVWGYGGERSETIVRFAKVPEDHNDMVFGVVVNRFGFVGGLAVLLLYAVMIIAMLRASAMSKDPFARLAIVGFATLVLAQMAINIGMNVGLLPVVGITLPFVSYGGSSLVAAFAMVGLVNNFASRRPTILARPSFEFDRPRVATST